MKLQLFCYSKGKLTNTPIIQIFLKPPQNESLLHGSELTASLPGMGVWTYHFPPTKSHFPGLFSFDTA